jgi:Na+/H+ antiporter NhaD/arsenite permease-like protein
MGDGFLRFLGAVVVIAANAGGAWTPIGDVTTTMLWIHGHISSVRTLQVGSYFTTKPYVFSKVDLKLEVVLMHVAVHSALIIGA